MLFGLLQFWLAQEIFGDIGTKPVTDDVQNSIINEDEPKLNPFTNFQLILIVIAGILGLSWIINDPVSKISEGSPSTYPICIPHVPDLKNGPSYVLVTHISKVSRPSPDTL